MGNSNEKPFRLRPHRSKGSPNDDPRRYVGALGSVLRFVQMAKRERSVRRKVSGSESRSRWSRHPRLYSQRVSVRVTYARNKNSGQWKAHGHYIARDSATKGSDRLRAGFDAERTDLNIAAILDAWQRAGDERIFKIIVSPEFGERLDLPDQTRKLMQRMERDLVTTLEWVAAVHINTEHPHVHIALRGRNPNGTPLRLERDYIRSGIRLHAEDLATEALGYRTERDREAARQREIAQDRFTGLDRIIQRSSDGQGFTFLVSVAAAAEPLEPGRALQATLAARLAHLEKMGLARAVGPTQWEVQQDFEKILRAVQQTRDRQKMLAAHGAVSSDPRLPFEVSSIHKAAMLEGRVLLHAEDEANGQRYLLLEGIDARLHVIYHTADIEEARRTGKLAVNHFVHLKQSFAQGAPRVEVADYGDADSLLNNDIFFKRQAQVFVRDREPINQDAWGGWLGQYHQRLRHAMDELRRPRSSQRSHRANPGRQK